MTAPGALTGKRTYVGFGFGAIQAGLFLYEAFRSGNFRRLVVAEVVPAAVDELRRADGFFTVNIAGADRIWTERIGPVEVYDPGEASDRQLLVEAVAAAEEIGTAVPSVKQYVSDSPASLHRVLAAGLALKAGTKGPRAVVYAAENHNSAAEILEGLVRDELAVTVRADTLSCVRFLNTVIGKMSGLASDPAAAGLATVTPESQRAFLVEEFNRILVSRVSFDEPFERGLNVFEEKPDLLPFEEAKLYGHNAVHALAACLGRLRGVALVSELREEPGMMAFLRDAFLLESGEALIRKHRGGDPLFTPAGYAAYADDLLARMTNVFLMDTVERVGRDLGRKLLWDDRLIGTLRLALEQKIVPRRFAIGAAAAFAALDSRVLDGAVSVKELAAPLWKASPAPAGERERVLALVEGGRAFLRRWRAAGFPDIQEFFGREGAK